MNHALLPDREKASLPVKYEAAKIALAECNQIDECKDWGDKAQALASYAKQADDTEMEKTAQRIRARAIRRCGELLKEIEKATGAHLKRGGAPPLSRKDAAKDAGLSPDQAKQSIRVANVPERDFEAQLESDTPPTVTALAEQGKGPAKGKPIYERLGMTKKAFQAGIHGRGAVADFVDYSKEFDPQDVVDGSTQDDCEELHRNIGEAKAYLKQLETLLNESRRIE